MAYDRDDSVSLVTDYYNFCNQILWNATVVQAPPGGWHSINQEILANLKRNDTVIDLLRHIPYIDYFKCSLVYTPLIMTNTPTTDYRREDIQKTIREGSIERLAAPITGQDPAIPPSCAAIAICRNRNGYEIIPDTNDGYIY